jgi:hypothetical protein
MAQNWIIDKQLNRRNISPDQRTYLIGKRYKEEKKAIGENQYTVTDPDPKVVDNSVNRVMHNAQPKSTVQKIAEQSKVNPSTIQRAEKFADAVDKVSENVGRQSCKTIRHLHDQAILQDNPPDNPATRPNNPATRPDNPAPARPDNPETQSCYTTRQSGNTILLHDQTILHDTFERLKFSQLNTAYSQTHGLIITDSPAWLQVVRFRNGLKRRRVKADILQL